MRSITRCVLAAFTLMALTSLSACIEVVDEDVETGTIDINLVGQGSSGASYRLRDATISVAGASTQVWNTEDDPDLASLSGNVAVGDYTATLSAGWRLERLVPGGAPVTVDATLESANPVAFAVAPQLRTAVPLRFRVGDGVVDLTQGYDITIDVDDPTTAIVVSATVVSVLEDGGTTLDVRLSSQPAGSVSVLMTSSDPDAASIVPSNLIFAAASYALPQPVTIYGTPDADLANEVVTMSLTGPGLTPATIQVQVIDTDSQAILTTAPALVLTEGETGTVGVRLAFEPATDVNVSVVSASTAVASVLPASLTFTPDNYDVVQAVTVTAPQDADSPPSNGTTVLTLSTGTAATAVTVTVFDNDTLAMNPMAQALCPGDIGIVAVRLLAAPPTDRTLTLTSTNPSRVQVLTPSLTFTPGNWSVEQVVEVDALSSGTAQLTLTGPGLSPITSTVTVRPFNTPACQL